MKSIPKGKRKPARKASAAGSLRIPVHHEGTDLGVIHAETFRDVEKGQEILGVKARFVSSWPAARPKPVVDVAREVLRADHLNWYQLAVVDSDPYIDACGHEMKAPYVDPPPGGYPPGTQGGDDGVWSDKCPWYADETPGPGEMTQPPYLWWQFLSHDGLEFTFQDDPVLQPPMYFRCKTWLVAVSPLGGAPHRPHVWLPGFEWESDYRSSPWKVRLLGPLTAPPTQAEYGALVDEKQAWFWLR